MLGTRFCSDLYMSIISLTQNSICPMVSTQKLYRKTGTGFLARGCPQLGLTRWGWLWMSHQQDCCDMLAFRSWGLYSATLKICYSRGPESCCFSATFSPLASLLCVTVFQSKSFVTCWGEFLGALEGNSSSSSEYLEIWLRILPLERFLAFVWDKIPLFYDTWDISFPPAIYWVILGKLPSL